MEIKISLIPKNGRTSDVNIQQLNEGEKSALIQPLPLFLDLEEFVPNHTLLNSEEDSLKMLIPTT
jgi:hypothetical protein